MASVGEIYCSGHILPSAECIRTYVKPLEWRHWGIRMFYTQSGCFPGGGGPHKRWAKKPSTIHSSPNFTHTTRKTRRKKKKRNSNINTMSLTNVGKTPVLSSFDRRGGWQSPRPLCAHMLTRYAPFIAVKKLPPLALPGKRH